MRLPVRCLIFVCGHNQSPCRIRFDKQPPNGYNVLNKGTVGQCTPDRRENKFYKNSALLYQSRGAIFVLNYRYDKGNYSTKHDDKRKQVTVCNHKHQPPFFRPAAA